MPASNRLDFPPGIAQLIPETAIPDITPNNLNEFFLSAHLWLSKAAEVLELEYDENKGGEQVTLTMNNREADFFVQGLQRLAVAMEKLAIREQAIRAA